MRKPNLVEKLLNTVISNLETLVPDEVLPSMDIATIQYHAGIKKAISELRKAAGHPNAYVKSVEEKISGNSLIKDRF